MDKWSIAAKTAFALPLAALGSVLGAGVHLAIFFIATALADWITGTLKAMKSGCWTSSTARDGLWHKTGEFISLLVAAGVDLLIYYLAETKFDIRYTACLLPVVCVWYICTELGSILENIGQLGAPIPKFLCRAIAVLKSKVDETADNIDLEVKVEK